MNFLSGNPEKAEGVRCTKEGIPLVLGPLIDEFRRGPCPATLRMVNTILFSTRSLKIGKDANLNTITGDLKIEHLPNISIFASSF